MIRVLLTVPSLSTTESPYREMMAIAKYLPRDDFKLTICTLRDGGYEQVEPLLRSMGASCFVGRFRPRKHSLRHIRTCLQDQGLIRSHGPFDIQHSLDFTPSPIEAFIAKLNSRLYVYNQRDNNENGSKAMLKIKISLSKRIIPISDGTRNLLLSYGAAPSKIRKIYNGIDFKDSIANFPKDRSTDDFSILAVGHMVRRKRIQDAIDAFWLLSQKVPNASFNIAGKAVDEQYFKELEALVQGLGLSSKVRFLGIRSDIMELLADAKAFLHCAESEGVPWAILEAMNQGVPIVASNIDGINEVIEHEKSGLLVSTGDIAGFSNALCRIAENSELSSTLAKNAFETVREKFSAKAMVDQLQGVYREMLA